MAEAADTIIAWQCVGCGRLEAPQTCVGVCKDRKVRLVAFEDYQREWIAAREAEERAEALTALVRRFVAVRPRQGGAAATLASFQAEARRLIAPAPADPAPHG